MMKATYKHLCTAALLACATTAAAQSLNSLTTITSSGTP